MNKLKKLAFMLAKQMNKFATIETDKGTLTYEGVLEVGTAVFVIDENGDESPAPDGDYVFESMIYTITGGVITDVREPATRVEEMEDASVESGFITKSEFDAFVSEISLWKEEVTKIISDLVSVQEDVEMKFNKIKETSVAKSINSEKKVVAMKDTPLMEKMRKRI